MVLKRGDDFGSRFIYIGIRIKAVSEKGGIKRAVVFRQGGLDMYLQFHCETRFVSLHVLLVRTSVYCFFLLPFFNLFWGGTQSSALPLCVPERERETPKMMDFKTNLGGRNRLSVTVHPNQLDAWMWSKHRTEVHVVDVYIYIYVALIVEKYMLLCSILW